MMLQHPNVIWLMILLLPVAGYACLRSPLAKGPRKLALIILSLLMLGSLLMALAGPYRVTERQGDTAVFLIDLSSSIPDDQLALATERVRTRILNLPSQTPWQVVGFAAYPVTLSDALSTLAGRGLVELRERGDDLPPEFFTQTDLEAALIFARALIKQRGRIMLCTDGLESHGCTDLAQAGLTEQGISVEVVDLATDAANEVVLTHLEPRHPVQQGQKVSLQVTVESSVSGPVQVEALQVQTGERQTVTRELSPGTHVIDLDLDTHQETVSSYQVTVSSEQDTHTDNNQACLNVPILARPNVAVMSPDPGAATTLGQWLQEVAEVHAWSPDQALGETDLLILADGGNEQITRDWVSQVRQSVQDGLGLWILPGPGLIAEGLLSEGSDLAELLPVKPLQVGKQSNPNTTVVFIIDTSGSMRDTRIQLAKEIARMGISHLNGHDKVGIVEFYGARRWAAPIQSAANRLDINRALNRLTAGGGTIILPALEEAHYALLNTASTTKHIVVISDAGVESADYESMLRKIASDNISVSTVLVGPAAHTGFMADLAQWGRGAFFHAGDRFRLPDMNFKSVQKKSGAPLQQNEAAVTSVYDSSLLDSLIPATLEIPETTLTVTPKVAAQIPLSLTNGRPLLSHWQYGLGQVAFWSTDVLHDKTTASSWGDLVANQCRRLYRSHQPLWDLAYEQNHDQVTFTITTQDPATAQPLQLIVQGDSPQTAIVRSPVRLDGRHWVTRLQGLDRGFYRVTLNATTGEVLAQTALALNHTPEVSACHSDTALLQRMKTTGANLASVPVQTHDLRPRMLGLALLCLLGHVILRRLPHAWLHRILPLVFWAAILMQVSPVQAAESPITALLQGDMEPVTAVTPAQDYAGILQQGYGLYKLKNYDRAFARLSQALPLAQTEEDQKYALAWTLLAAQKAGQLKILAQDLLGDGPLSPYQVRALLLVYGLQGDLTAAMALHDQVQTAHDLSDAFKLEITREVLNLASINGHLAQAGPLFKQAAAHTSDPSVGVGLVKLHLLNGDRDLGLAEMERLAQTNSRPSSRLFLAEQAQQMAFYTLAVQIAEGVMADSPDYAYQAGLFLVRLKIQRAHPEEAMTSLRQMTEQVTLTDKQIFEVAQVYEQLGHYSEAMDLYQRLYERNAATDVLMRMAWLHEKNNDLSQAYDVWYRLWTQCNQEHLLYQIQPRLLDLGSRTGQLAALAVQLEHDMATDGPDPKALGLLIDLYVSVGDPISAVELAKQYYGKESVESLQQQQRIYLRCQEFGRCNRILGRLLEIDPENTQDTLQQMAVLALERGNERDALAAAEAINSAQNADLVDAEYAAGVLALMDRTAEAAEIYYHMLQDEPDNAELWLLWANTAQQAGLGDTATDRLVQLLNDDSASDDVFTIAVDGLLNLEADEGPLQAALDKILSRLSDDPAKVYFYRLAVDVLEELQLDRPTPQDLLMLAAPYAPDRRAAFIREAQQHCLLDRDIEEQLDLGILLVTMDYQLPPQYYMDLGMQFLEQGQESVAQALFHHHGLLNENPRLGIQVIDYYDRNARYDKAAALTRECLTSMPDDLALRMRSAAFDEVAGNRPLAFRQYKQLYELSLGAMSLENVTKDKHDAVKASHTNVNAGDRYSLFAWQGLLVTDNPQTPLSGLCREWSQKILHDVHTNHELSPLYFQFWRDFDALCLVSEQLGLADRTAQEIMVACSDTNLINTLINNRSAWGLYPAALKWTRDIPQDQWPQALINWAVSQNNLEATETNGILDSLVKTWILNDEDRAHELLERLNRQVAQEPNAIIWMPQNRMALVITSLVGKADQVKSLILKQLESPAQPLINPKWYARTVWTILEPSDHRWLVRQLESIQEQSTELNQVLLRAKINCGLIDKGSLQSNDFDGLNGSILTEFWPYVSEDQRQEALQKGLQAIPENRRKYYLWDLCRHHEHIMSQKEIESLLVLFEAQPPSKVPTSFDYSKLWIPIGTTRTDFWNRLAVNLMKDHPDHWAINAINVMARVVNSQHEEAMALADEVFNRWMEGDDFSHQGADLLRSMITILPREALEQTLDDLLLTQDIMGATGQGCFLVATLYQFLGQPEEARAAILKAFELSPKTFDIRNRFPEMYLSSGHYLDYAETLERYLTRNNGGTSHYWNKLAQAYMQADRLTQALDAVAQDRIEIMRNRNYLALHHEAGESEGLCQAWRKYMVDCRRIHKSSYIKWPKPSTPGGILGFEQSDKREFLSVLMGQHKSLLADWSRYWRAVACDDKDLDNMAQGMVAQYHKSNRIEELTSEQAMQVQAQNGAIPKIAALQRQLLLINPAESCEQVDDVLLKTDIDNWDTMRWVAQAYLKMGRNDRALRVLKWVVLNRWNTNGKISDDWEEVFEDIRQMIQLDPSGKQPLLAALESRKLYAYDAKLETRCLEMFSDCDANGIIARSLFDVLDHLPGLNLAQSTPLRHALLVHYLRSHQWGECQRHLRGILVHLNEIYEPETVIDFPQLAAILTEDTDTQRFLDASQESIEQLLKSHRLPSQAAVPHLAMLAVAYFDNNLTSSAEEILDKIVTLLPERSQLSLWLVDALDRCGRSDEATALFDQLKQASVVPRTRLLLSQNKD